MLSTKLMINIPQWAWILSLCIAVVAIIAIVTILVIYKKKNGNTDNVEKAEKKESSAKSTNKSTKKAETASTAEADDTATAKKPANKVYHVSKRKDDNMWQVKAAGAEKAIKLFKTQKEAIDYCKKLAENQDASIMIHKEDGSFRKLTY